MCVSTARAVAVVLVVVSLTTRGRGKLEDFMFEDWFDYSKETGTHSNMITRDEDIDVLVNIMDFYKKFEYDIDIGGALGLFLLKLNLEPAIKRLHALIGSYYRRDRAAYFYTLTNETIFGKIQQVLDDADRLLERFTWKLFARVPRVNVYRKVASVFLYDDENWRVHTGPFAWSDDLSFPLSVARSWIVPDFEVYRKFVNNVSLHDPDIDTTSKCLEELSMNPVFHIQYPQRCNVPDFCYDAVANGTDFGYALSHRMLLLMFAESGRNCYFLSFGRDRRLQTRFCQLALLEMDYLEKIGKYSIPGLMLEFMSFCALRNYRVFLRQSWVVELRRLQTRHGCFASSVKAAGAGGAGADKSWWKVVRGDKEQVHNCDRHMTALAASMYAASVRAAMEPAYCAIPKKDSAIWFKNWRYCWFLPNVTKQYLESRPVWLLHTIVNDNWLQLHEFNDPARNFFFVFPTKDPWWNKLPGFPWWG